jgi:LysM repeat protein
MIRVGQQLVIPTNGFNAETRAAIAATQGSVRAPSRSPQVYTVRKGDTLSGIAKRYGTSTSSLKRINGLSSDRLRIGQKLRLRSPGSRA